jgi:hypothetical protein
VAEYLVTAAGCDDKTQVLAELDDAEAAAVRKVADLVTEASESQCQPRLRVVPVAEADPGTVSELRGQAAP